MELSWTVFERNNVYAKDGTDWALSVFLHDDIGPWVYTTWEKKPTDEQIRDALSMFKRACAILWPVMERVINESIRNARWDE